VQLTNYRTSASGDTGVSFPKLESWNRLTKVVTIAAEVNKKRVLCRIPLEILISKFGDSDSKDEPLRSVALHRTAIQDAARKLIEGDVYEEDGSVLIRARDL